MNSSDTAELLAELKRLSIKHTPENMVRIARRRDGTIVFLETGDIYSGLKHILIEHRMEFAQLGIEESELSDLVMMALVEGEIVGFQKVDRPIYRVIFNRRFYLIAVTVGNNGYIVSANPRSRL